MKTSLLQPTLPALASLGAITPSLAPVPGENPNLLWHDQPAAKWKEALPVGQGRLSAMILGQPAGEQLQLNQGTLWAGGPHDPVNPKAQEALPQVRQRVHRGQYREAAGWISAKVMAKPHHPMSDQTVRDLLPTFPVTAHQRARRRSPKAKRIVGRDSSPGADRAGISYNL